MVSFQILDLIKFLKVLQKGDVYVEDRTNTHPHGHIAIYDGSNWISDFIQKTDHVHSTDPGTNYYYRKTSNKEDEKYS